MAVLRMAGSRQRVAIMYRGGIMPRDSENVGLIIGAGLGARRGKSPAVARGTSGVESLNGSVCVEADLDKCGII